MSAATEHVAPTTLKGALHDIIESFQPDPGKPVPPDAQIAAHIAALLQLRSAELQTAAERKQQRELDRMIQNPHDKATMIQMTDQTFRSEKPRRAVDQLTHILDAQGVPRYFSPIDKALIRGFQSFGGYLPGVAVPLIKEKMRAETANVILPADEKHLNAHLSKRRESGLRMNVNLLGEAILGEGEAARRLDAYVEALRNPEVESISVKASTIFSQLSSVAYEHTVAVLCDRLEHLYREAERNVFKRADGSEVSKFVYLDMEEHKDLAMTAEAFMQTLDRPGLEQARGGIALQAYVPDSYPWQCRIYEWARRRAAAGGRAVTVRLVKGANMEAERVEASARGWPQAPYKNKLSTDANFRRMVHEALKPENIEAVTLGIASHNLFELSYALVLAAKQGCLDRLQFEMLEGMANHMRRALFELTENFVLYAPATHKENFVNAIGYLVRRLDENTGPDNFLSHAFKLVPGDDEWQRLEGQFFDSFDAIDSTPYESRRTQDRRQPVSGTAQDDSSPFDNEPDTDFSLPANVEWANDLVERWQPRCGESAMDIPIQVAGEELAGNRDVARSLDPSRPGTTVARYRLATSEDIGNAVATAKADPSGWRSHSARERSAILGQVAEELRSARGDLMGAAMAEGGKVFLQSDPEVSEAIDFCEYYRRTAVAFDDIPGLETEGRGVVAVISPWNFPIAIPCGGVAAALAAGNTVLLKPASDTVMTAWLLCQAFWRGGVPKEALQFVPCKGSTVGAQLATHDDVDVVILTGGTDTALNMLDAKPNMDLLAETGGKNATIVTSMSDRDLAIAHVLQSAFGHAGQKCSATSLLILEQEVWDDSKFRRALEDAAESIPTGSAWEPWTIMGPLIRPPGGDLERGLRHLVGDEEWLVEPRQLDDNPCSWSPGIKWNVEPGSFMHMTELFGPVLGVMKAKDLDEAIELVNETGYGLTSGLESLDDREQDEWRERIRAGNLYVNRVTTGAIVLRQPFGGMGKSAFGPGIKAGGPNYVAPLMTFSGDGEALGDRVIANPALAGLADALADLEGVLGESDRQRLRQAIASYDHRYAEEFGVVHDHFRLIGQDNLRRYLPVRDVRIRVHTDDSGFDVFARAAAARATGTKIVVSYPDRSSVIDALEHTTELWGGAIEFVEETDEELAAAIRGGHCDRLRYAARERVPEVVLRAIGDSGVYVASAPVLAEGRVELLWYLREQSISFDYHRYGTLGDRAAEDRSDTL
jgi:RHH-type proline utilization regulon transcriptional repressor/proline dehydrogenase/delta 1-pyrroline-5-carboxylate dehydrogenase